MASSYTLLLLLAAAALATVPASAQMSGCATALIGLTPCLGYIGGNSTAPGTTCCSQLASVVSSEPQCLCLVLAGVPSQYGYSINLTQALALPGACKIQTPPASECKKVSAAAAAPAGSTAAAPPPKSSPTKGVAGNGSSKSTPGVSTADGSAKASFSLVSLALLLLSSVSVRDGSC